MPTVPLTGRTHVASADGGVRVFRMAPGETDTFAIDWSNLIQTGEALTGTPTWTISVASLLTSAGEEFASNIAEITLTASSSTGDSLVTCSITTATTVRTLKRSIVIHVRSPL